MHDVSIVSHAKLSHNINASLTLISKSAGVDNSNLPNSIIHDVSIHMHAVLINYHMIVKQMQV